jgi:hypothetical protein
MNSTLSMWIVGGTILASASVLAVASPTGTQEVDAVLKRLSPVGGDEVRLGLRVDGDSALDQDFAADHWLYKLTDADLEQRERNFDEIVGIVRRNPQARAWLEQRAADPADPELAWTARLALREAGARQRFLQRANPQLKGLRVPQVHDLQDRLRRLLDGTGIDFPMGFGPTSVVPLPGSFQGRSQSERVQMESGPDGVKVTVTETVDGETSSTTYEAESLEGLLEAHPELRDKVSDGHAFRLHFGDVDRTLDSSFGIERLLGESPFGLFEHRPPGGLPADPDQAIPTDVLGVYVGDLGAARAASMGLESGQGLVVQRTEPGTIAGVLGIGGGDVLLSINGVKMDARGRISDVLAERPPDGELTVVWLDSHGEKHRRTWVPAPAR